MNLTIYLACWSTSDIHWVSVDRKSVSLPLCYIMLIIVFWLLFYTLHNEPLSTKAQVLTPLEKNPFKKITSIFSFLPFYSHNSSIDPHISPFNITFLSLPKINVIFCFTFFSFIIASSSNNSKYFTFVKKKQPNKYSLLNHESLFAV